MLESLILNYRRQLQERNRMGVRTEYAKEYQKRGKKTNLLPRFIPLSYKYIRENKSP